MGPGDREALNVDQLEHLLAGIDARELGYQVAEHVPTAGATHVVLTKRR